MCSEWHGAGTPMSRSSSASSVPDERYHYGNQIYVERGKRPFVNFEYVELPDETGFFPQPKRPRYINAAAHERAREPPFFILREAGQSSSSSEFAFDDADQVARTPSPALSARVSDNEAQAHRHFRADLRPTSMERTSSGLSIASDGKERESRSNYSDMRKDEQAASRVERHFAHYHSRARDSKAERILKSLISPRSTPGDEFEIDNAALQSIFSAANEVFFHGSLKNRVRWDWSDGSNMSYHTQIIGTTALRVAQDGGFETLIVLSSRYLKDRRYNRRLLISTFLHELIHSYLFIRCGFKAKRFGGHTSGFHRIARLIDEWAGPDTLFLSNMEADLDDFRLASGNLSCDDIPRNCGMQCSEDVNGHRPASAPIRWPDLRSSDQRYYGNTSGPI
ncbi:hypothetical protein JX265_005971 [Neoarthrinium moseri]|uniref:SprT-like domain-containing protein n=1 Tax=Neoarthrinium moseri TaxID=1658444 RepID=A0A9Q0APH0_9PEZI|nr:uncharacterized protein JN550_004185 [Neoarthrinium moseri]KAI1855568.1 hypothetical protein JX266_000433 [Neoarthrinium moseri]KAI1870931.1 hypothetical protein JX265_005971 [Neoarthrinium moseri]KAI1871982.1 hypothetical protein JN550_004185 [Neoarthrinium moseri]